MQLALDLCWLIIALTGSTTILLLRRIGRYPASHALTALTCIAFIAFPIVSWDDDLLRAKASDSEDVGAWTEHRRAEKNVPQPVPAIFNTLPVPLKCFGGGTRITRPLPHVPIRPLHHSYPPLGQRPPPVSR
jgi:hypothetical protein